ncbi:MAG: NADH-quinone oxidoreductase subunit H, partial [Gaiellaceae bacterium]
RGPAPDVLPWLWPLLWFLLKVLVIVYVYIWIRATLPRIRYDRLMAFGWKRLIPFGLLWVMLTGAIVVLPDEFGRDTVITAFAIGLGALVVISLVWPLIAPRASEEVPVP